MPPFRTWRCPWGRCEPCPAATRCLPLVRESGPTPARPGTSLNASPVGAMEGAGVHSLPTPWGSSSWTPTEPGRGLADGQWVTGGRRPSLTFLASSKPLNCLRDREKRSMPDLGESPPLALPFLRGLHPCPLLPVAPSLPVSRVPVPHLEGAFLLLRHPTLTVSTRFLGGLEPHPALSLGLFL